MKKPKKNEKLPQKEDVMKNDYNGLSLFLDIRDKELRAFNQANVIINLANENKNFQNYMEALPKDNYIPLWEMLSRIKKHSLEEVKKEMMK